MRNRVAAFDAIVAVIVVGWVAAAGALPGAVGMALVAGLPAAAVWLACRAVVRRIFGPLPRR